MDWAPGPGRKRALLGAIILSLVSARVESQSEVHLVDSQGDNACRWPHNGTGPPQQFLQGSCNWMDPDQAGQSAGNIQENSETSEWKYSSEPVAGQFIVRFLDYKLADAHSAALRGEVDGSGDLWRVIDRKNAAARFPTDFVVVEINLQHVDTIKDQLAGLPFVKDVHPEQRVRRSLAWSEKDECEKHSGSLCDLGPHQYINKRPGRFSTKPSQGLHNNDVEHGGGGNRKLRAERTSVTSMFKAELLWNQGFHGELVKMGVFDTGIRLDHPHVKNIRERTNWTHEPTLEDGLGHGTFVAGVIGGTDASCPGFAPDVELYTFRVFTNDQVSYTSWFLDAFNYAIGTEMNVVNLSIGGPDYLDLPFVEKVWEITSSGILMVSAIGNDGPLYGTLNNPADQNDVIGVGGIDYSDKIASFSSRGMSTWELPRGYGRAKPDVVAYGRDVMGSRIQGGCRSLSGTSVASPVVAGAICLLASTLPAEKRWHFSGGILNPASMKQALVEGAEPIPEISMYEQGQGKLNLVKSKDILADYTPRASVVPGMLDFRECPFLWPFCRQPIYANAMPLMFNATVLNGMGLTGTFAAEPLFTPTDEGGKFLDVRFEHSDLLWPWSGFLALYIYVRPQGSTFNGTASGDVSFTIVSPPMPGEGEERKSLVNLPITVSVIPTPPREKRILWDQFHSLRYPPAYLPRDSLDVRNDILDWHGDHPHTNYHDMYDNLRDAGYFLEVLGSPFSCFDAHQYGALLVVDSEEEFYEEEVRKLHVDVEQHGLGLLVFAEWYNVDTMVKMRFFDDNTRSWWTPVTGGGNVPALNDLLGVFGIGFGDALLEGQLALGDEKIYYASGVNIVRFPAGGTLHAAQLADKATAGTTRSSGPYGAGGDTHHAVLGLASHGAGRVVVYGDSNCLDSSHQRSSCFGMLHKALQFATEGTKEATLFSNTVVLATELGSADMALPNRRQDVNISQYSLVRSQPLLCYPNAPLDFELVTIPHRGASHQERASAVTKIKGQTIVTNLISLNSTNASTADQQASKSTATEIAAASGRQHPSRPPPPPGLKRFLPMEVQQQTVERSMEGSREEASGDKGALSNEASEEDAKLFLGGAIDKQSATSAKAEGNTKPVLVKKVPEVNPAGASNKKPAESAERTEEQVSGTQDLVKEAEERQKTKEAKQNALSAAVNQEKTIDLSGQQIGVRSKKIEMAVSRSGQEAETSVQKLPSSIFPDKPADTALAVLQKPNVQMTEEKTPKYDSIDPMSQDAGGEAAGKMDIEGTRKEAKYLEAGGEVQHIEQFGDLTTGGGLKPQISLGLSDAADPARWRNIFSSFNGVPQVLAVVGVVGVFILWHVRQRKRAQENSPLRDRASSTRVLTLGMLGTGADTSTIKSRQRLTMERSPASGR